MKVNLMHLKTINDLARTKSTGRPDHLAKRLGISARSLSDIIKYMRENLETPIVYDRKRETYYYQEEGYISFKFQKDKELVKKIIKLIETSFA